MNQIEKLENNRIKVSFVVPSARFDEAREEVYNADRTKYDVPGFMAGQAPFGIAEAALGPGTFYEEAGKILIQEAFNEFRKENPEIEIISRPEIKVTRSIKGSDFEFYFECEVMPEIVLGDYKNLTVTMPNTEVTVAEEEIDRQIAALMTRAVGYEKVERPAQNGDAVVLDYQGLLNDVPFEGGTAEKYTLVLGSGSFIPGFEDQLIGISAGEERDVCLSFPEQYHAPDLAGKAVVFKCKVHEVQERVQKSLDDVVKQVGFETIEDLREDIRQSIKAQKEQAVNESKRNLVVSALAGILTGDIPETLIATQIDNMMQAFGQQIQSYGQTMEAYLNYSGETEETMREKFRKQAETSIRCRLALERIVRQEEIAVSDEEVDEQLTQMGQMYQMSAEDMRKAIGEQYIESLKLDLLISKALDHMVETVKVVAE